MGLSTNDLLMEHPTRKGWYAILGRADDQIMLSTGEKVSFCLPLPCPFLVVFNSINNDFYVDESWSA